NSLTAEQVQALNQSVQEKKSLPDIAARFLRQKGLWTGQKQAAAGVVDQEYKAPDRSIEWWFLARCTLTHLKLTFLSLLACIAIATPLGVAIYPLGTGHRGGRAVMYAAGVLQTIPSIALLAFMIPVFGIGAKPAVAALFLYGLLPILRNTATALFSIDPVLRKVSVGMGLTAWQRLRHIEVPLAAPTILAGIKTAAGIHIRTATPAGLH